MDIIEWIKYIDKCMKNRPVTPYTNPHTNPYPTIFANYIDYMFFAEDQLDLIPVVKNIHTKIMEKYPSITGSILKLYILTAYFLCIKFYSDSLLIFPIRSIRYILDKKYTIKYIRLVEIDILEMVEYNFPLSF